MNKKSQYYVIDFIIWGILDKYWVFVQKELTKAEAWIYSVVFQFVAAGWLAAVTAQCEAKVFEKTGERIFKDGDFVERVLSAALEEWNATLY